MTFHIIFMTGLRFPHGGNHRPLLQRLEGKAPRSNILDITCHSKHTVIKSDKSLHLCISAAFMVQRRTHKMATFSMGIQAKRHLKTFTMITYNKECMMVFWAFYSILRGRQRFPPNSLYISTKILIFSFRNMSVNHNYL